MVPSARVDTGKMPSPRSPALHLSLVAGLWLASCATGIERAPATVPLEVEPYEVLELAPDPLAVPDAQIRRAIAACGRPWKVRHRRSGIELVLIPPGTFERGASLGDGAAQDDERPARTAAIEQGFYLGRCEVTQGQWVRVEHANPSSFRGEENLPVDGVSWTDLRGQKGFLAHAGGGLRLPSESEWEYAARAGSKNPRHGALEQVAWHADNSAARTHGVGQKAANAFGLCDVLGNVSEWCEEPYESDPGRSGTRSRTQRTLRGASWAAESEGCRVSNRLPEWEGLRASYNGVRVAADFAAVHAGGLSIPIASEPRAAEPKPALERLEDPRLPWATVLEVAPDPLVIQDPRWRERIVESGWPWRVRHDASGVELLLVPPGDYRRGASQGDDTAAGDEKPAHRVRLTQPFYLGRYEVTQEEWQRVMGANPARATNPRHPVERISWLDARGPEGFLSVAGAGLRLPSEAEWEYAARAGSTDPHHGPVDDVAWHEGNSEGGTHPVGLRRANALGFHDMLGNVWEWCEDWYTEIEYLKHTTGANDPKGPERGNLRVLRGGSWYFMGAHCRASVRVAVRPGNRSGAFGLRVALTP
jgi:formylglycine-generating enzyme required for sulfatase activity